MPSRRGSIALTDAEQAQYLADSWTIQIASNGPKGFPHLVAMWYVVIDSKVTFTTFAKSQKIMNLKRDPKITAMLESGKVYNELKGLVIEGEAEIVEDTDTTMRVMEVIGEKYNGIPADSSTAEARRKVASKRATVRIKPVDVYSWDHAKLGGVY